MRVYLLSPQGVPMNQHLFPMFIDTWKSKGVEVVSNIRDSDAVFFDFHTRIAEYNQRDIDWITQSDNPIVCFDEYDRGNMSDEQWPQPITAQQESIFIHSHFVKSVHFCRLLDKTQEYPFNLFPYEKPFLYDEGLLSSDELFNREYDICFIANHSPSREKIAQAIEEDGRLKTIISLGATKIPFNEFLKQHKKAKLFISSGAGGFTDERVQLLFSVAGIVRERSNQWLLHDFAHMGNCLRIDSPPTKQDIDILVEIVNNKERLYEIYQNGYEFVKTFYSREHIANNILETIEANIR